MTNPGVGTKFVSVNLNKSYGQSSHAIPSNSTYGSGRGRAGGYGGGGSGMVVLSRPRSSHKAGPKLSVPPPLNLPSLRKEHERFDSLGSASGSVGGGGLGIGPRPTSSGTGWSKPGTVAMGESDGVGAAHLMPSDGLDHATEGGSKGCNTAYMPPSTRMVTAGRDASSLLQAGKATVLRGEDFPSLRATIVATNVSSQKQKEALHQKQRQAISEELSGVSASQREVSQFSSHIDMRPQLQPPQHSMANGFGGNGGESPVSGNNRPLERSLKQEDCFPGPLPLVQLSPRSDWADDERDTSHRFTERGRDNGFSTNEAYWDKDFDLPRSSILPHKPTQNHFRGWVQRDNDIGKALSNEVPKADPRDRDARTLNREGNDGNSWRNSLSRDGFIAQEVAMDRNGTSVWTTNMNQETSKENKYIPPQSGGNARDDYSTGITSGKDSAFRRNDAGYGQGGRQLFNNSGGTFNGQGPERIMQDRYGRESNRHKMDAQNSLVPKPLFSSTSKGLSLNDPLLCSRRERHSFSGVEKPYTEDPFLKDWGNAGFDGRDPFSGSLVGLVKRKKDVSKLVDFHDPVRESFEAELEKVQRMQEQERQQMIEERERALEIARREEEERQRLVREQEESQRQLEEELREAAWRAEQERLEGIRKAEEQRIAREEEKRRILMEEERRKQAAKQKLLELEERMARRQAEAAKMDSSGSVADDKMPAVVKGDVPRAEDVGSWEDSERMVERITNSASSDSSSFNISFDVPRDYSGRHGPFAFMERQKPINSWRQDAFENDNGSFLFSLDQDNGHQLPRQDGSLGGRAFPQNDYSGGAGYRAYYRGGMPEPPMDDFPQAKGHKWSFSGDGEPYSRNTELELVFHEHVTGRIGDMGWSQGRARGNLHSTCPEQLYQNPEQDELYSVGRSRYSARQPRVLPPPSLASVHRTPFRSEGERAGPSKYEYSTMQYNHALRSEPTSPLCDDGHFKRQESSDVLEVREGSKTEEQKHKNSTSRCDSQSSLSVSSPPTSPTHLSHDDVDESGDSPVASAPAETNVVSLSGKESFVLDAKSGKQNMLMASSSISFAADDEWTIENNEGLQEQEDYDEDEDAYCEEDEVHGDDENFHLTQEFEGLDLEGKDSNSTMDNVVLGFDQGVEVGMPSNDYERSPRNDESSYLPAQVSVGINREKESFDGGRVDEHNLQFTDGSPQARDFNSKTVQETEKGVEDMVNRSFSAPYNSASSDLLNSGDTSSGSVLPAQQLVSSSLDINPHSSGQVVTSELPVKLQFGLFSGPSLIPSPVPAIQIGSIQMPLQLHPQVGPSLTHMHPPQPPLFHFGQVRYPSAMSHGSLPLAPQSMLFVQPNVPTHFPLNQKLRGHLSAQPVQDSSAEGFVKDHVFSLSLNNNHVHSPRQSSSQDNMPKKANLVVGGQDGQSNILLHQSQREVSNGSEDQGTSESGHLAKFEKDQYNAMRNSESLSSSGVLEHQVETGPLSQSISGVKDVNGWATHSQLPISKGRKFSFTARNPGQKSFLSPGGSHSDSYGFQRRVRHGAQRMEFRVQQSADRRQSSSLVSSGHFMQDPMSNFNGKGAGLLPRGGQRKEKVLGRPKQTDESETQSSDHVKQQQTDSETKTNKGSGKQSNETEPSHRGEGSLKRSISSEDNVDTPLHSGVVRIFQQPGIEAPSDEDDFIEVRSKRQMLNDRREQREKEIKAKSNNVKKGSRKSRSLPQGAVVVRSTGKIMTTSGGEAPKGIHAGLSQKQGLTNNEASAGFKNVVSQPLAPIGTPSVNSEVVQSDAKCQAIKSLQTISLPDIPSVEQAVAPGLTLETKNKGLDGGPTSLGWGNSQINQQVIPLTRTQLDEAMKPARFNTLSTSVGEISSVSEPSITSSSILPKDTAFSPATSPINSLLAGEKIQFGAVTSPTILPPSCRVVSHDIGPPGPPLTDLQVSCNMPVPESECAFLFEKEKHSDESGVQLEDSEAEAEAAASAVAVAAISNDEVVVNGLDACSVSISDTNIFYHAGLAGEQESASQSKVEETLSVSLPADLSVENPPISLWPHLPSTHNSSQMVSPFPGGIPSHFPFYDVNPMLGSPIFAFRTHEESAGTQSQPQKSSASGSGPLGTWQQCHSGLDSFYGPLAGFPGPFGNPSGSIPTVQGPPHMVVYNHFAPVGQFGQVGLSYMGATYIPSGKQPNWKHNPASVAMVDEEGEMKNLNMVSAQQSPPNIPLPVQHLAPGSPLLSMASPLAMFDVSPFQTSSDVAIQGHWTPIPVSPLHSSPQSTSSHQQPEGAVPSQFQCVNTQSLSANRFTKVQTASAETGQFFVVGAGAASAHFPDELGLVDPPGSTIPAASANDTMSKGLPGSTISDSQRTDAAAQDGSVTSSSSSSKGTLQGTASTSKTQASQHKNSSLQQYNRPLNYNYQRGGVSQKNGLGAEWSNHKMGFNGRHHSSGGDRGFPPAKVKQIYVAKQSSSGTATGV